MNREQAKETIKSNVSCLDFLIPAANRRGNTGYCCPACDSGHGGAPGHDGAAEYFPDTNTWSCHACKKGGDVISLYMIQNRCDFNAALYSLSERAGLTIDGGRTSQREATGRPQSAAKRKENTRHVEEGQAAQTADFSEYYKQCAEWLDDPLAISYLTARGISENTAHLFNIGYDPLADPANAPGAMRGDDNAHVLHATRRIIIPCNPSYYVARSIEPDTPAKYKALNPNKKRGGGEVALFNGRAAYDADVVFICEGIFDALSFVETGHAAIATNSKGNGALLLQQLEARPAETSFIICHDNDADPNTAAKTMEQARDLARDLQNAGYKTIVYNVAGRYHDANDALTKDRATFEKGIAAALEELNKAPSPLPGLLTAENAAAILQDFNSDYIMMPRFMRLSHTLELRAHDTVVLAADTGVGKSSLALNFLYDLQDRYPALYINLEMDEATILQRLVAIQSGMELDRIKGYSKDPATRAEVNKVLEKITARKPLQMLTDVYDLDDIDSEIQRATRGRTEPTIVFIDTALLVTTGNAALSRYERFTKISEGLRRIARANNIILFALLQQSREGKKDEGKRPTNASLKESGSWENDATKIMFLWDDPKDGQRKIIVTKNRSGKSGEKWDTVLNYACETQSYYESGGFVPADNAPDFDDDGEQLPMI